jgi:hypothetical protein
MRFFKRLSDALMGGPFFLILFGLVFFGVGAGLTYRQRVLEGQGVEAQGEVIYLTESCDEDGCTFTPVVRFKTWDGRSVSFKGTYSSSPPAYEIGETVIVNYSLEEPVNAVIKGEGQFFRIIFMIVGGVVITIGLVLFGTNIRSRYIRAEYSSEL